MAQCGQSWDLFWSGADQTSPGSGWRRAVERGGQGKSEILWLQKLAGGEGVGRGGGDMGWAGDVEEYQVSGRGLTQAFGPHRTLDATTFKVPAYKLGDPGGAGRPGVTQGHQSRALATGESVEGEGAHSRAGRLETAHSRASCLLHESVSSMRPKPACCVLAARGLAARGLAPRPCNQCVSQTDTSPVIAFLCAAITK